MKRESLSDIDLVTILQNAEVYSSADIEVLYNHNLAVVHDAHHGDDTLCYIANGKGIPVEKKAVFPTKRGWNRIEELKKRAQDLSPFEKGETILFRSEFVKILDMNYGLIQEITDGAFRTSGYSLNDYCFKLTNETKAFSRMFLKKLSTIEKDKRLNNLNYSNVYTIIIDLWKECMLCIKNKSYEDAKAVVTQLNFFISSLYGKKNWRLVKYNGISVRL